MFQSLTYIKYSYRNGPHLYKLIDSDFVTEIAMVVPWLPECGAGLGSKIAKEYERRGLNPAANLALYYNSVYIKDNKWSLDNTIKYDLERRNVDSFAKKFYDKYLADIRKYMLLI